MHDADVIPPSNADSEETIFSICRRALGRDTWGRVRMAVGEDRTIESFPGILQRLTPVLNLPGFVADLARLELACHQTGTPSPPRSDAIETIMVNPTLGLITTGWKHLVAFMQAGGPLPQPADETVHVLVWRHPQSGALNLREAANVDLLALKIAVDGVDIRSAAKQGAVTPKRIQGAIDQAVVQGILLSPESRIRRLPQPGSADDPALASFLSADVFTLQWHVTQRCDLSCKHCYDRSDRAPMPLSMAMKILDDFFDFCHRLHARGQVTVTGGNPLLYPHFEQIYKAAWELGFGLAILGNPTPKDRIEDLLAIGKPHYIQISLEGLEEHNDYIRGKGHFSRSMEFLDDLRSLGVTTTVMLTLTRENMDQVIPLAGLLKDRADSFTFNRLVTVGEGAKLLMPEKEAFASFLRAYVEAAAKNPIMNRKENLINVIRMENGQAPFGGCTGYGCGAAFNFMALLPDGEVHACRKFPSLIGNVHENTLYEIYLSDLARRYRTGSSACFECRLNIVCRGCPAVVQSMGLDPFADKDPFCFAGQDRIRNDAPADHFTQGSSANARNASSSV